MADSPQDITEEISWFTALCTALRFLTVIPVSWRQERDSEHFRQSILFFPLVGLMIGGAGSLLAKGCVLLLPISVTAFLLVLFLSAISGFLHLDGLADSGDGLLSYRSADRSLEIMRDSRVGAMGVIVLVLLLLGKYSAISSIPAGNLPGALLLLPVAGRVAILVTMAFFPYARKEGGLGALFMSSKSRLAAGLGILLLVLLGLAWLSPGQAVVCAAVPVCSAVMFGLFCRRRLGGITGDTLGAACELTELLLAIALSISFSISL